MRPATAHGERRAEPALHTTIAEVRAAVAAVRGDGPIVLVPTMGALHSGHFAHVRRGLELGGIVVVSIFVNPLQFGPAEDLDLYPRDLAADLDALADAGAHHVFAPAVAELYPAGAPQVGIHAGEVAELYEGASRPGHFDGMLTVVAKLLHIVRPDVTTFGQKDAQQLFLVRRMVADLDLPVRVEAIPIVREPDGLALSSRNRYLEPAGRAAALGLSRALREAREHAGSGRRAALDAARALLEAAPGPAAVRLDYLDIVDPATFHPIADDHRGEALAIVAAHIGSTRLIDNETITVTPPPG